MAGVPNPAWWLWLSVLACFLSIGDAQTSGDTFNGMPGFLEPLSCATIIFSVYDNSSTILSNFVLILLKESAKC